MSSLMEQGYETEVEEIIHELECPKDFEYCKSGLEVLGKAKDVGEVMFRAVM
jgi:hypothetical protein